MPSAYPFLSRKPALIQLPVIFLDLYMYFISWAEGCFSFRSSLRENARSSFGCGYLISPSSFVSSVGQYLIRDFH